VKSSSTWAANRFIAVLRERRPPLRETEMLQPNSSSRREQIVDTMIELTRLSKRHRAIIAGDLYLALRRRGFFHVATTVTCRLPRAEYSVGLVTGQNSLQALEATLVELSRFLRTTAAIAVLIDSREAGLGLRIRAKLEQLGFRIEAGVRCQQGFVLSAHRRGYGEMRNAA
jgi:hypothetical protein